MNFLLFSGFGLCCCVTAHHRYYCELGSVLLLKAKARGTINQKTFVSLDGLLSRLVV